jgi:hypothetical protein
MLLPYLRKVDTVGLLRKSDTTALVATKTNLATKLTINGDSPAGTISAGTNNSNAFNIETNNTTRASFMANGNILINDAVSNGFDNIEIGSRTAFTNGTNNNLVRIQPSATEPNIQIVGTANTYLSHGTTLGVTAFNFYGDAAPSSTYRAIGLARALFPNQGASMPASGGAVIQFNPSAPVTPGPSVVGSLFVDSIGLWYVNRQARTGNIVDNTLGSASGNITIATGQTWLTYTGAGGHTWTLPTPRESREIKIKNKGSGTLTISGILGGSHSLLTNEGIIIISDGTDWMIIAKYVP